MRHDFMCISKKLSFWVFQTDTAILGFGEKIASVLSFKMQCQIAKS